MKWLVMVPLVAYGVLWGIEETVAYWVRSKVRI